MYGMNSGYSGWSMSRNAVAAYDDGEMPKSKWTKKAMIEAVEDYCSEYDLAFPEEVRTMRKDDIFFELFKWTSWHHTSKFANETDFYGLNERALERMVAASAEKEDEPR